ncbi:MAG: tyrosine-type recombinase/integrase [Nitrosomonas sp.]|nr:tyrosine-type recombinase/integrase [Nitrosomonas sp.]
MSKTVNQVFAAAFKQHWSRYSFIKSGWAKEVERLYSKNIAPTFAKKEMGNISAFQIRRWHSKFAENPYTGNRALEVFSRMFSFAQENEWIESNNNPCKLVRAFPERKRKRYASEEELHRVLKLLNEKLPTRPLEATFLLALIYTGARPRALTRLTWGSIKIVNIDGNDFAVAQYDGKNSAASGEEETLVFPPAILSLMRKLPTSPLVFGIPTPRSLWQTVRKEAGCPDLWARDFRRTFATLGLSNDIGIDVIAEVLNHKSTQTSKIYAKVLDTKRIEAVANIAEHIKKIAG